MLRAAFGILLWSVAALPAHAEPGVKLRMATVAPDGSAWARELHALSRDIETQTAGRVTMKWYFGGIAGDELESLARVRNHQLDGLAGAIFCERVAPSLWVARVAGLVRNRKDAKTLLSRLRPAVDRELDANGIVGLGLAPFGTDIVFSRAPVRSMSDLKKQRFWVYDLDEVLRKQLPAMGLNVVPLSLDRAGPAYDDGKIDGFIGLPTSMLAWQWTIRARYFTTLPVAVMPGCLVVSHAAFDAISIQDQQIVRAAAAKFIARFIDVGEHQDDMLLSGLFERQGVHETRLARSFEEEFRAAAVDARSTIGPSLIAPLLWQAAVGWLR